MVKIDSSLAIVNSAVLDFAKVQIVPA